MIKFYFISDADPGKVYIFGEFLYFCIFENYSKKQS